MTNAEKFDHWLGTEGPVAVIIREELEPVTGSGSVFFPPTFAPPEGVKESPGYLIDQTTDLGKVALVDTVGAQANRIEPIFKQPPYAALVPSVTVRIGERQVDLLDVGHRAADAVVRFSDKWTVLRNAFLAIRDKRDATQLAKLAPTSLIFGVWDSRDTQVKLPRVVGSTIRAYRVEKLTRSAQFFAATEKEDIQDLAGQDFLSSVGLDDAPAGRTDGGVIAQDGIRREAILNLIALRALAGPDAEATRRLQRYALGLALVALLARTDRFLRQGCLLVPKEGASSDIKVVDRKGTRSPLDLDEDSALTFAQAAADAFGVGVAWTAIFDPKAVKTAAEKKSEKPKKAK
jgi:CRISPR-associated protein Csb1